MEFQKQSIPILTIFVMETMEQLVTVPIKAKEFALTIIASSLQIAAAIAIFAADTQTRAIVMSIIPNRQCILFATMETA